MGTENLKKRIVQMHRLGPLFVDFTWRADGSSSEQTLSLAVFAKDVVGDAVNMHLTCTGLTEEDAHHVLTTCRAAGIRNIVALRGDLPSR